MKKFTKYSLVVVLATIGNIIYIKATGNSLGTASFIFFNLLLEVCLIGLIVKPVAKKIKS